MPRIHENDKLFWRGIWVLAESAGNRLHPVTLELLSRARRLSAGLHPVEAVAFSDVPESEYPLLARFGAETIRVIPVAAPGLFREEERAEALTRLIGKYRPAILLAGATIQGRSLLPRTAALVDCGLTADCTGLEIEPASGALLQTRPAFGGNLMATIRSDSFMPQMATVRPGVMKADPLENPVPPRILREAPLPPPESGSWKEVVELLRDSRDAHDFSSAELIIAGGRGMGGPAGFDLLRKLADATGGMVGATRAAVDAGWVPYGMQIGQTGRTVQPKIYLACGISGQIQHRVGMQSSGRIIAVNRDPDAPIMELADVTVVGDVFTVIPQLLNLLQTRGRT
ncbi:MAG: Acryloyl-CoA reductase electron transfer subunit beta [Lentisphaerae bacterium ADurb.Bin242]|nr:MAG: Acryloyl-CoA reductase electron transfer subunit beta [Lentisphaerae bacterium ADurb.Bin242]